MDYQRFLDLAQNFLAQSFDHLREHKILLASHWHIDHLCFRTESNQRYEELKHDLSTFSKLLIESEVNGRLISTFKLQNAISYEGFDIDLIELPAPKKGKIVKEGFEHFEIVSDLTFEELKHYFSGITIDESGTKKLFNKELEFCFENFAIKFHHQSLESVIHLEKNDSIEKILKETNILNLLDDLNPLIINTFLLDISIASSDFDILIQYKDKEQYIKRMKTLFTNYPSFKIEEYQINHLSSILTSFSYNGLSFEIFAQEISPIKQNAYLHFLTEERLLKLGGNDFKEMVMKLRREGLKTEPAFATALKLKGDAFEEMLKLQKYSNHQLKSLLRDAQSTTSQN